MKNPGDPNAIKNDVLHSQGYIPLSSEAIAKAVARHKREHSPKQSAEAKPKGGSKRK
jgi:hypothetical protein